MIFTQVAYTFLRIEQIKDEKGKKKFLRKDLV